MHKNETKVAFLNALSDSGNVRTACDRANVSRRTVYGWREKDRKFRQVWEEALHAARDPGWTFDRDLCQSFLQS